MSSNIVPLVTDTDASISLLPYKTDLIGPLQPVQHVLIKRIASGLEVRGYDNVQYKFYNDAGGELQAIDLCHCLYKPQCTARPLCPHQLGLETNKLQKD